MEYLKDYNSNLYIKICSFLNQQLEELFVFISNIRKNKNYSEVLNLEYIYKDIFSNILLESNFEIIIERVLYPHYSLFQDIKPVPGNSSFFISIKIKNNSLNQIDLLYNKQLTSLIRLYKSIFSVIDNPNYGIQDEYLKKYEDLINDVRNKISDFLASTENKHLIQKREKLKLSFINKMPYEGFFHMTHIDNLESILTKGLLSNTLAHKNKLVKVDISNNKFQEQRNRKEKVFGKFIHDYVPLYIKPQNPMMDSVKVNSNRSSILLLEIIPHILVQKEKTLFSDGNAAQQETNFYHNQSEMENVDWNLLQKGEWVINTESHRIMCSEVLIPEVIEVYYINKIILRNSELLDSVIKLFPNHKGIEIDINESYFKTTRLN